MRAPLRGGRGVVEEEEEEEEGAAAEEAEAPVGCLLNHDAASCSARPKAC